MSYHHIRQSLTYFNVRKEFLGIEIYVVFFSDLKTKLNFILTLVLKNKYFLYFSPLSGLGRQKKSYSLPLG